MVFSLLQPRFLCLAGALTMAFSSACAQTQAMPVPTPIPSNSIPSVPTHSQGKTSTTQQSTQPSATSQLPTPADTAQPATVDQVSPAAATPPPATNTTNPPSRDPLEQPLNQPAPPPVLPVQTSPPANTVAYQSLPSMPPYDTGASDADQEGFLGGTYIPVDSPMYPMALRLYSMGYLDTAFLNMRPWTRRTLLHMLQKTAEDVNRDGNEQAQQILARLLDMLSAETPGKNLDRGRVYGVETVYTRLMGITGTPLRDSFHLGQTLSNDYGRPYGEGFNNVTGFSSVNEMGRFSLYVRGEFQHGAAGRPYSLALANTLSCIDEICPFTPPNAPQATIPYGKTANSVDTFRLQEATVSAHLLGHEISFGKSDAWLGPGMGGAMAWSNNAEDMYSFRINRVEPLNIPYLSRVLGPLRYDFFVGSLKGHTFPNDPWAHSEMFSFAPTSNFQFGFQRTIIWGGKGHTPITLHTFLKGFFDLSDTTTSEKLSREDPGARYSVFNFSYRLPFVRKYVTLYADTIAHDDVTPPSAPRRAAYRPGVYISHIPHAERFDFRIEGVSTDTSTLRSLGGQFNYYEIIQRQGYTNKGFIMGDWIGREAKGGQAWLTYHLSADEFVQLEYLNKKTPKDFIPMGTTQNQVKVELNKRLPHDFTVNAWLQYERWKAPIWLSGQQSDTTIAAQFTWWPKLHTVAAASK